jgi:ABC-2 type transport system permease protein
MTRAVHAELRKFFTTRLWWGMAIGVFLLGAGFAALTAFLGANGPPQPGEPAPTLADPALVRSVYTGGLNVGYLLTLAIGIMTIGAEYRHKTVTSTFLAVPRRTRVMLAKIIALLGIGALYGAISLVGSVGVGATIIAAKGFSPFPDSSILRTLALSLLVLGLWALIGLGAGILIPNQVASLLITIGIAFIVDPIVSLIFSFQSWGEGIAPYFPSRATSAITAGATQGNAQELAWWAGALVLAAYAAVMAGIGSWLTVRRDIS